jgi:hypothetical protein
MRTTTAYFAGVGTVVAAVAMGLGGGFLISNIVSPHEPKTEMSKLELRMSSKPIQVNNAPPEPVPQAEVSQVVPAAQAQPPAAQAPAAQPPAAQQPPAPPPAETAAANSPPPAATPANESARPASREQAAAPENAMAKARDADVKRVTEKRKAERRQQWVERRRHQPRQDLELREVEQKVREETEPRELFATEPVRLEAPRIRLFGGDDE